MLKHDYPYIMNINEWMNKTWKIPTRRTGSNTWKLWTTTNFNIPGWVQSDASREKHRTPAGSLFCRPASTAQSVLALLVRRGFVDYLHRHCQIYRRSSATRWCLKDKRIGQNPYTHYIILSLILPYLGGWHQSSFIRWSHSSSISVSYGHQWHSFDLATCNVVSKHGVQDHVFACLVLCIYIYTHTIFWDITAPSISSTHQIYTSWLSMFSRWVKIDALIARGESLFELFVLIFCTASFWCPIIFTCFEILDPDIN